LAALAGATGLPIGACRAEPPDAPALDAEHLQKILKRLQETGRTRPIPSKVSEGLGATHGDQVLNVREIAFERAGYQHGFYRSIDGADRFILAFRTPDKKWTAFLTDTRLKLISAVAWDAGEKPVRWTGPEANQAFENELAYWATIADIF
jgi:hypothetical protein